MKHFFSNIFEGVKHRFFVKCKSISINSVKCALQIIQICCGKEYTNRGGSRGRLQGVRTPPPPEMTCGFLLQLVLCKKKTMRFIGVEVEQETSAPPPKKNPGSATDQDTVLSKGFFHLSIVL